MENAYLKKCLELDKKLKDVHESLDIAHKHGLKLMKDLDAARGQVNMISDKYNSALVDRDNYKLRFEIEEKRVNKLTNKILKRVNNGKSSSY